MASTLDSFLAVPVAFSLAQSCGPIVWGKGRWPNVDWIDGHFVWAGWEGNHLATRWVRQSGSGVVEIGGNRDAANDAAWMAGTLGFDRVPPTMEDPLVAAAAERFPGMRPYSSNSLFEGVISCIAGQSISVAAAAITHARIAALVHPGVRIGGRVFWPAPTAEQLCKLDVATVRTSGVTWKRAEAIVAAAEAQVRGEIPSDDEARLDPETARIALLRLKLVGYWTAESALLWGLGLDDAFPPNDAALRRAVRLAYGTPELDHKGLEKLAEGWRPGRAWASRWLWAAMFGLPAEVVAPFARPLGDFGPLSAPK